MATKSATATAEKPQTQGESNDSPLLDKVNAAVKKMIAQGKEKGFVTYDELNKALPPEEVSSEQIEDTMSILSEAGVNVVESEDAEEASGDAKEKKPKPQAVTSIVILAGRTIRSACICGKWAVSNCCPAKVKSPSPSGLKPDGK